MNIVFHQANERGYANHGWLQANHSFSFASFYDETKMGFGKLRVLNDDIVSPNMGFATHPHHNMEIITIPLSGKLKHKDSLADEWQEVLPNEVQVMSSGKGVYHSEMNASSSEDLQLFQIWIEPNELNVLPRYDQKSFNKSERKNKMQTLVAPFSSDVSALKIHQQAVISRIDLDAETNFTYELMFNNNGVYMMNINGEITFNNNVLMKRDVVGVTNTDVLKVTANKNSEVLFIEVPMK